MNAKGFKNLAFLVLLMVFACAIFGVWMAASGVVAWWGAALMVVGCGFAAWLQVCILGGSVARRALGARAIWGASDKKQGKTVPDFENSATSSEAVPDFETTESPPVSLRGSVSDRGNLPASTASAALAESALTVGKAVPDFANAVPDFEKNEENSSVPDFIKSKQNSDKNSIYELILEPVEAPKGYKKSLDCVPDIAQNRTKELLIFKSDSMQAKLFGAVVAGAVSGAVEVVSRDLDFLNALENGGYRVILADFDGIDGEAAKNAVQKSAAKFGINSALGLFAGPCDEEAAAQYCELVISQSVNKAELVAAVLRLVEISHSSRENGDTLL